MSNNLALLAASQNDENQNDNNITKAKAFKFGQVDKKKLLSRLISTPFQKPQGTGDQEYVLDMTSSKMNKPRLRKLELPPKQAEPVVCVIIFNFLHFFSISILQHRLYSHQQWNAPQSIQARNRELLLNSGRLNLDNDQPINKQRKLQENTTHKNLEEEAAIEIGEDTSEQDGEPEIKFVPRPPETKRPVLSPIGRRHTRGAHSVQVSVKGILLSITKKYRSKTFIFFK
jgi:hypothetical protein